MKDVVNKLRIDNMRTKRELVQLRQEVSTTDTLKVKLQRAENELSRIRRESAKSQASNSELLMASRGARLDIPLDSAGDPIPPPPSSL